MAESTIEVLPQPRLDSVIVEAASGMQRRRTEYAGTAWFGGRPEAAGYAVHATSAVAAIESPFFLPDSLPYRPDPLEDAQVACSIAIQGAEDGYHQVLSYRAGLVPDPRNAAVCWLQIQISARARTPFAVGYRVVAVVAMNAVMTADGGGQP